ncbi:MAG TPA: hypothetical protein VHW23_29460 [Kofleriaceae bacterium]|jgi:hypothetical protein|nr:hypothetical protein [Kofleriaceae bacterium]
MIRAVAAILVCATAGCGALIQRIRAESWAPPQFAWADPSAPAVTAAVPFHGWHQSYHYTARREPSGVTSALRAVAMFRDAVYAAGDDGVMLRRTARTGWVREPTPTTRTLRGLLGDALFNSDVIAVGDAGTVLRRSPDGTWIPEAVPTTADLYGITTDGYALYAVGDHGTLLQRDGGTWRAIPTHTTADLRSFDGTIAIGRGGAIVDCRAWDTGARPPDLHCVPRRSPTRADLLASLGGQIDWRAYGTGGTRVRATRRAPIDAVLDAAPTDATITAAADASETLAQLITMPGDDGDTAQGSVASILVGTGGTIEILGDQRVQLAIPGAPDLLGVALELTDVFVVGAGGTIVHLQTDDVPIVVTILV